MPTYCNSESPTLQTNSSLETELKNNTSHATVNNYQYIQYIWHTNPLSDFGIVSPLRTHPYPALQASSQHSRLENLTKQSH